MCVCVHVFKGLKGEPMVALSKSLELVDIFCCVAVVTQQIRHERHQSVTKLHIITQRRKTCSTTLNWQFTLIWINVFFIFCYIKFPVYLPMY